MPSYWSNANNRQEFERLVRTANPTFERILSSSIRPLIEELKVEPPAQTPKWLEQIRRRIRFMKDQRDGKYRTKANKYKDALYHLLQVGIPTLLPSFTVGGVTQTQAYWFVQTPIPASFDPAAPNPARANVQRIRPPSDWVDPAMTVEDFVARGNADGVLVIHVQGAQKPDVQVALDVRCDGWTSTEHMNSVLRVAKRAGVSLYVLNMYPRDSDLAEANNYPNHLKTVDTYGDAHCGQHLASFRNWLGARAPARGGSPFIVVMGYDGAVCVDANVFGTNDRVQQTFGWGPTTTFHSRRDEETGRVWSPELDNQPVKLARPLISLAHVVTSRALLATGGALTPPTNCWQFGQLTGLTGSQ